jgi:hypothetical protein
MVKCLTKEPCLSELPKALSWSAAAEHAPDPGQEAAAGVGIHLDRVVHPTHAIGLAVDDLARQQINRQRLHDGPGNLVLHVLPLFVFADRS